MAAFWRIVLFTAVAAAWAVAAKLSFPAQVDLACIIGGPLLVIPVSAIGRLLLDHSPTAGNARVTTAVMHALIMTFYGVAVIKAASMLAVWRIWTIPLPQKIGAAIFLAASALTVLPVANLAIKALGAPFALALSRKLSTAWLYRRTRNPMVLATIIWFMSIGLALKSASFVAWSLLLITPAELFYLKVYEERELEIRFGQDYVAYRKRTPFLWPRLFATG